MPEMRPLRPTVIPGKPSLSVSNKRGSLVSTGRGFASRVCEELHVCAEDLDQGGQGERQLPSTVVGEASAAHQRRRGQPPSIGDDDLGWVAWDRRAGSGRSSSALRVTSLPVWATWTKITLMDLR